MLEGLSCGVVKARYLQSPLLKQSVLLLQVLVGDPESYVPLHFTLLAVLTLSVFSSLLLILKFVWLGYGLYHHG